ncbi:MAG: response regulator [Anaerolineae bacterium]|nr:response regulator [Anaerolineae bacterium]
MMRKRILVVDDVPDWRAILQDVLKSDYEVKTVDNYQAAMDVIRKREAELVIVDLRLSPTDENDRQGMELLKQLAEHRINSIVLTGYPERALQEEAQEKYKAFEFIDKSKVAGNLKRLREVVREAFKILEKVQENQNNAIQAAAALQPVKFTPDLSPWPLQKYRKK